MMFKILNGREHFWQWDTGQKLIVDGDICSEVHFCNGTSDCSPVCEVHDGTVDVPNILLQEAKFIKAYAYVCGEDNQYTECVQMFLVMPRTKPDDYVYTETEVKCYETLERRKVDKNQGAENAGKLLYIGADGIVVPLTLGNGLEIVNGILMLTNAAVTEAICGRAVCGEIICGGV